MKRLAFICFWLMAVPGSGQEHDSFKLHMARPKLKSLVSKADLLYAGLDNIMQWVDTAMPTKMYKVKVYDKNDDARWSAPNQISVGTSINDSVTVWICKAGDKDTTPLTIQKFLIARVPDPHIGINGKPIPDKMPKSEMKNVKGISVIFSEDIIQKTPWFTCQSFAITIGKSKYVSSSAELTQQMKAVINSAPIGAYIVIDDVKLKGPDGITRPINGAVIQLTK